MSQGTSLSPPTFDQFGLQPVLLACIPARPLRCWYPREVGTLNRRVVGPRRWERGRLERTEADPHRHKSVVRSTTVRGTLVAHPWHRLCRNTWRVPRQARTIRVRNGHFAILVQQPVGSVAQSMAHPWRTRGAVYATTHEDFFNTGCTVCEVPAPPLRSHLSSGCWVG